MIGSEICERSTMKNDLVPAQPQPPPAGEDGYWGAIWGSIARILTYLTGNNPFVEVLILISQVCANLVQRFRRAPAAPDVIDGPEQQEDGPTRRENRGTRNRRRKNRRRNAPDGTDEPDTTYPASHVADGKGVVRIKRLVNDGDCNPVVMDAQACRVNYVTNQGQVQEQRAMDPGKLTGANRLEIDEVKLSGKNSPFMLSASHCDFNYEK
ncbi:uncharacterized protein LOC110987028 [Acanthaster planci]|uniref:Uncharacterized protein LOC110987028 n=1 Tax=Acanthaster planci TaxID=133434 RepID=A0A8B7ZJQ8_ACAPL|nr:uncharacterized protein LOC110987028 [Acanthaster planci]